MHLATDKANRLTLQQKGKVFRVLEGVMFSEDGQLFRWMRTDAEGATKFWKALVESWGKNIVSGRSLTGEHG